MNNYKKRIKRVKKDRRLKLRFSLFVITVLFGALFMYVVYLKVAKGEEYEQRALRQYTNRYDVQLYPMRGSIMDRNMKELAVSMPVYNVILDPVVLNENSRNETTRKENIEKAINELSERFDIPRSELEDYMREDDEGQLLHPSRYVKIKMGISRTEADELKALELKGVWTESDSKRSYPYNELAANIVGFTRGGASWGLESYYNSYMTGEPGRAFITYIDSATPVINTIPAKDGGRVITTIDLNLQEYAEEALKNAVEAYKPENGAIIALNPKTGEVLAMAVYPSFNPNFPMDPIYMDDPEFSALWEAMDESAKINTLNGMWKNYSTASVFEPGSIFKPIVIAAALDEGTISLNDTFHCGGIKTVYDRDIKCHYEPGHGIQTVEEVLANSCNIAMMDIAALMGHEMFYKHFTDFGFGERTEIDLPGEESAIGTVYDAKQMENPVNLATSSFGQGSACTPIQALNAFAAVINGGSVMRPYIVSQVIDAGGNVVVDNKPSVMRKIISAETSDTLRYMMQSVVDYGTGKKAQIPGYSIGGKTGTGEQGIRSQKKTTLTFIGYLPVEDPNLVALALIDRPYDSEFQGSATAAPMLKEFLQKAIMYMGIKPANADAVPEDMFISVDSVTVPDFNGMTMDHATEIILSGGLKYEVSGGGNTIEAQWPKAGTKVDRGTSVTLYTKKAEGETAMAPVPNVIGLREDTAFKTLIENSFKPIVDAEYTTEMVVTGQFPMAGQHAYPESDVLLIFGLPVNATPTESPQEPQN